MPLGAEGEFALVTQHLQRALERPLFAPKYASAPVADHNVYALLADTAAQQRDLAALERYVPLAEELANHHDHSLHQAIAHRAWGVAHRLKGDTHLAEKRLGQALDLFEQMGAVWQIGRTHREMAELFSATQDTARARDHYQQAQKHFEQLGAVAEIGRLREALGHLA
jgi:tetratricopeptide (TPR) repeat protein